MLNEYFLLRQSLDLRPFLLAEYGRSEVSRLAGDGRDALPWVPAEGRHLHQRPRGGQPGPVAQEIQVREVQEPGWANQFSIHYYSYELFWVHKNN